jgi:hypothetical protein
MKTSPLRGGARCVQAPPPFREGVYSAGAAAGILARAVVSDQLPGPARQRAGSSLCTDACPYSCGTAPDFRLRCSTVTGFPSVGLRIRAGGHRGPASSIDGSIELGTERRQASTAAFSPSLTDWTGRDRSQVKSFRSKIARTTWREFRCEQVRRIQEPSPPSGSSKPGDCQPAPPQGPAQQEWSGDHRIRSAPRRGDVPPLCALAPIDSRLRSRPLRNHYKKDTT